MPDVVDLIMTDHREVERMFDQLRDDPQLRPTLLPVLTTLLAAHSRAEEAEVYPAARDEAQERDEVEHSQEEHLLADQLLQDLAGTDPLSTEFDGTLQELVRAVTHHVQEEETSVLPGLRERLSQERLAELARAFADARAEHLGVTEIDLTKAEMLQQAANAGIPNASTMTKEELERELRAHADS